MSASPSSSWRKPAPLPPPSTWKRIFFRVRWWVSTRLGTRERVTVSEPAMRTTGTSSAGAGDGVQAWSRANRNTKGHLSLSRAISSVAPRAAISEPERWCTVGPLRSVQCGNSWPTASIAANARCFSSLPLPSRSTFVISAACGARWASRPPTPPWRLVSTSCFSQTWCSRWWCSAGATSPAPGSWSTSSPRCPCFPTS